MFLVLIGGGRYSPQTRYSLSTNRIVLAAIHINVMGYRRVLLTGATSFLGKRLLRQLLEDGHHVIATSSKPSGNEGGPNLTWIQADFTTTVTHAAAFWRNVLRNYCVDVIINNAGITSETEYEESTFYNVNVIPVNAMVLAAVELGVKPFVQISSSVVSLHQVERFGYANSKKHAEDVIRHKGDSLDWTIIRSGIIFDENGFGHPMAFDEIAALPLFTVVIGDGEQQFQPVFMGDIVRLAGGLVRENSYRHRIIEDC